MTRNSPVSSEIYKKHIKLYRYINDTYIFSSLMLPEIKNKHDGYSENSSEKKRAYRVPKRDKFVISRRKDADVRKLLHFQHSRGFYESLIIGIISRVEAFLVEAIEIAISANPQKLSLLIDDKTGIPLDLVLESDSKELLISALIRMKSENLTYLPPAKYVERLQRILSIELEPEVVANFIEAKASRDIIVHGTGIINQTYLSKAAAKARGGLADLLPIDETYFQHVIVSTKRLSGDIAHKVEQQFG